LIETISDFRFEYPNIYVQDIRHVTGTLTGKKDVEMIPYELFNMNIYGETTNDESFFMPIRFSTAKYYRYSLYQTFTENGKTYYNIHYYPVNEHTKLLKGSFIVEKGTWRVIFFRGEGQDIFSDFSIEVNMGNEGVTNYLPVHFTIYQTASYLGNVLACRHLAEITYKDIHLRQNKEEEHSLNISDSYRIRLDSVPVHIDSVFWNERRPIPLQAKEEDVKNRFLQHAEGKSKAKNRYRFPFRNTKGPAGCPNVWQ